MTDRGESISSGASSADQRCGLILLVVLVMIVLLSLLAASFAFMVRANLSAVMAGQERFQARMAAESGIRRVITMLRQRRDDPAYDEDLNRWYDNPTEFQGGLVYGTEGSDKLAKRRDEDTTWDPNAHPAWRYNLVAPNYDEPGTVRYGITDECARLDINKATEKQLYLLFCQVILNPQDHGIDIAVLVDSLLDWRDKDGAVRPNGAEDQFYLALNPPYQCNATGKFSTVEELLQVRGFTAWVVFGEDYNRNGLLDQNEDDGDASFPPDNADGKLFPGVAAFLTVWSTERNWSIDNRPRIWLNDPDIGKLEGLLAKEFDDGIVRYVMAVRKAGTFSSVMNLLLAPPPPTSQPTTQNAEGPEQDSSDQEQSVSACERPRPLKLIEYKDLNVPEAGPPPATDETLPLILDRLTAAKTVQFKGRINISTAPREVLATIEELTDEEIDAIVTVRRETTGLEKATPAWLWTKNVLDRNKFRMLLDGYKTDSGVQKAGIIALNPSTYRAEAVGYADHLGVVERLNVVFEMRFGTYAQVLYQRNLTGLGPAYNPHGIERRGMANRPK